jgi:hypothetical protein
MDKYNEIRDYFDNLDECELIELWNDFTSDEEEHIYQMGELDAYIGDGYPSDILDRIDLDGFSTNDEYFVDGVYGIQSFYSIGDIPSPLNTDSMTDYAIENDEDFGLDDIREILDYNPLVEELTEVFDTYGYDTDDIADNLDSDPEAIIEILIKIIKD